MANASYILPAYKNSRYSGWFVKRRLGLDIAYMYTKFDDSSFSHSRYITGAPKM